MAATAPCAGPTDPRDRRIRPSIYLEVDGGPAILVDTSTDLRQQALTYGVRRVDAILLTHSHADHVMGMDEVRRFNVLKGGPIPVFASAATARELRRIFQYVFEPPAQKGGGIPQIELREHRRPVQGRRRRGCSRCRCSTDDCRSSASASARSPISPTAARFPTRRGRCSRAWTSWSSTRCAIGRIRRTSRWREAVAVAERLQPQRAYFTHICHDLPHAVTNRSLPAGVELAYDGLQLAVEVA